MEAHEHFARFQELQSYVGWTAGDAARVAASAPLIEPRIPAMIDDFYAVIGEHAEAAAVITGGPEQVERLKGTLAEWLRDLLRARYDEAYVARRYRVGVRHVEIGLKQVYTNAALSRLRQRMIRALRDAWSGDVDDLHQTAKALHRALDLDLAIIEDAYHNELMSRLRRTERLATLGQIAGGVAHELRNPLNVVKTSVYYLTHARSLTAEKRDEHLGRIERHVGLADGVITALSNFARMPKPELRPVPLAELLRATLELNPVGEAIRAEVEVPDGLPHVLGDPDQLQIVFGNLIRNARDAMPDGGRLAILAREAEGAVEVAVIDEGVGIPAGDLQRILEPLYSTKTRGLGLGLAIVRSILEKGQGGLRVESTQGRGSTFHVRLPSANHGTGPGAIGIPIRGGTP